MDVDDYFPHDHGIAHDPHNSIPTYVSPSGDRCPSARYIIRNYARTTQGQFRVPLNAEQSLRRRTDRPDVVRWVARMVGRLVHDTFADFFGSNYESERERILNEVRELRGVDVEDGEEVLEILRDYRIEEDPLVTVDYIDEVVRTADTFTAQPIDVCMQTPIELHKVVRVEYPAISETLDGNMYGVTIDQIARLDGDFVAVELKTGGFTSRLHRMQASVQAAAITWIDRPMLIHLPTNLGEKNVRVYTPENDPRWNHAKLMRDFRESATNAVLPVV